MADEAINVGLDHGPPSFPLCHVDMGPDSLVLFEVGCPTTDGDGLNEQGTHSEKCSLQCDCVVIISIYLLE